MPNTHEIELKFTRDELKLLHIAVCDYRGKIGNLIGQLSAVGLATDEAEALSNRLGSLSGRMCDLLNDLSGYQIREGTV